MRVVETLASFKRQTRNPPKLIHIASFVNRQADQSFDRFLPSVSAKEHKIKVLIIRNPIYVPFNFPKEYEVNFLQTPVTT